ncbi:hypothetical protein [Streptomyces sp. NPDC096105]|uniref:hypothetical protein n=1 Tax=Streptomyces sp. NPDC096105 TaxID=3366074 RepID=UPI00380E0166
MSDRTPDLQCGERRQLAFMLPTLANRDLPPGRHLHHQETLMRLIDQDGVRTSTRSRLLCPAVLLPAAGLVLGEVLLAVLAATGWTN